MTLSIIITNFNQPDSVCRMVDQLSAERLDGVEIIVSDDCSTDGSPDVIERHLSSISSAFLLRSSIWGHVGGARNRGVSAATGDWIWFLDGDDEIKPGIVAKIVDRLLASQTDCLVFGFDRIEKNGEVYKYRPVAEFGFEGRYNAICAAWGHAIRRTRYIPFRERCSSEDVDWWLKQCDVLRNVEYMPDPALVYHQDIESYMTAIRWIGRNRRDARLTIKQIIETDILRKDGINPFVVSNEFELAAALWKYYIRTKSDVGRSVAKSRIVQMYGREIVP